jgi:hypothetical protein
MKYTAYDYEDAGSIPGHWHVYTTDWEPEGVDFAGGTLLIIGGPNTQAMRDAVAAICTAIDAAIDLRSNPPAMTSTDPTPNAQAFALCLMKHLYALIQTTEARGAPNAQTLIAACEEMLRRAFLAGTGANDCDDAEPDRYLVWSHEHRQWWGPNRCGYTARMSLAGRYSHREALDICANAAPGAEMNGALTELPVWLGDLKMIRAMYRLTCNTPPERWE